MLMLSTLAVAEIAEAGSVEPDLVNTSGGNNSYSGGYYFDRRNLSKLSCLANSTSLFKFSKLSVSVLPSNFFKSKIYKGEQNEFH